jgi:8-amino-7-oxononanoate synthase
MLGLEKDIAIRVHMCSKALSSTGGKSFVFPSKSNPILTLSSIGVILCNKTIRSAITHYSRSMAYCGAPSVPMIASIRAGYQLLKSGETQQVRRIRCVPLNQEDCADICSSTP